MYKFKVRPGYKSTENLVDFTISSADEAFFGSLFSALTEINVSKINIEDLWVNDEIIIHCDSDYGEFEISRDIYDLVFIMAKNNQPVILKIGEILSRNTSFCEEAFDPREYS
jgi:flavodoxin